MAEPGTCTPAAALCSATLLLQAGPGWQRCPGQEQEGPGRWGPVLMAGDTSLQETHPQCWGPATTARAPPAPIESRPNG